MSKKLSVSKAKNISILAIKWILVLAIIFGLVFLPFISLFQQLGFKLF